MLLGPLTLLALPVLGRFGVRPDNPTLLDRHYWSGWIAVVVVVCAGILVTRYAGRRRHPRARVVASTEAEGGARWPA